MTFPGSSFQFKHENSSKRYLLLPCSPLEYLPTAARQDWTSVPRSQSHVLLQASERNRLLDITTRKKLAKKTGIQEPRIQVSCVCEICAITPHPVGCWKNWPILDYHNHQGYVKVWDGKHLALQVPFLQNEELLSVVYPLRITSRKYVRKCESIYFENIFLQLELPFWSNNSFIVRLSCA